MYLCQQCIYVNWQIDSMLKMKKTFTFTKFIKLLGWFLVYANYDIKRTYMQCIYYDLDQNDLSDDKMHNHE